MNNTMEINEQFLGDFQLYNEDKNFSLLAFSLSSMKKDKILNLIFQYIMKINVQIFEDLLLCNRNFYN